VRVVKLTKMQLALGGALVLLGAVAYARSQKTANKGPGGVGITVECDPTNPGSCSGNAASASDTLSDDGPAGGDGPLSYLPIL
jgi:hypothetical protein